MGISVREVPGPGRRAQEAGRFVKSVRLLSASSVVLLLLTLGACLHFVLL